jgi:hypothetical protein
MYRKVDSPPTPPEKFELPFEGKLSQDNRWVMMAKLPNTSQTAIAITFLVMNLSALLRQVFCLFLCFQQNNIFGGIKILLKLILGELPTIIPHHYFNLT